LNIYLAFAEDERVGRRLLKGFNVDTAKLEAAIKAVREPEGNRPNPESRYAALEKSRFDRASEKWQARPVLGGMMKSAGGSSIVPPQE